MRIAFWICTTVGILGGLGVAFSPVLGAWGFVIGFPLMLGGGLGYAITKIALKEQRRT